MGTGDPGGSDNFLIGCIGASVPDVFLTVPENRWVHNDYDAKKMLDDPRLLMVVFPLCFPELFSLIRNNTNKKAYITHSRYMHRCFSGERRDCPGCAVRTHRGR